MPAYQTYAISDLKTGLYTAREPWKVPKDAFPTLYDARVDKGYLAKRDGYTELADTGAGYPIMGIAAHMRYGRPVYLVADRKRLYEYRPYAETLTDLAGSDIFTGSSRQFFWFQDWRDKCYVTNGADTPYVYDAIAETLTALNTVTSVDTDVQLDASQYIFVFKNRLLFFGVTIDGVWYPRRLYYSEVNTTQVKSTNWVDTELSDTFVAAEYVNGIPTLFGHEGHIARIKYTYDTDTPFTWEEAESGPGYLGPRRAVRYKRAVIAVGHDGLSMWDGFQSRALTPAIRDFVSDIEVTATGYMQATIRRDRAVMYLAYADGGETENNRILEVNLDENTIAIHRIDAHTIFAASGGQVIEPTMLDAEAGYQNLSDLDPVKHPDEGAYVLFGDHDGKLYRLNSGTTDDGATISASIYSAALNPFLEQGRKAYFGRLNILVSTNGDKSCTVSFYKDLSSTPYKQTTLAADGEGDKHVVTLHPDGEVANFHRISFTGDIPTIHAMELDFAPAGRLDAGGADSVTTIDHTGGTTSRNWRFVENNDGELVTQKLIGGTWTDVEVTDY